MKITKQAILLSALALGLGACSDENPWGYSDGEGGISLKLQTSTDVKDAIPVLRSGVETLEAPDASDFAVSLKNLANDEVQTWPTLGDFTNHGNFAVGSYMLSAYYGAIDDEGFDKPYFYGEASVQVLEGRQSDVEVTASLANSMISVDYTDAFKNYFKDYKVTVHSEGHSYVDFAKDELRPAYVAPGEVDITVAVTNPNGQSVTLQPAAFPAAAKHHYHITFDVNGGNVGQAQLQIVFDDSVVTEDVTIDLTDELFTSPAPKVSPVGFTTDGEMIETLEGSKLPDNIRFDVIARGGLRSAILTVTGENGYVAPCGNEVDLVSASADTQAKLEAMGIKAVGLYKNPSSMAYVDLTGFASSLASGKYSVSLVVKDAFTRCSEPLTVNFSSVPVELTATPGVAIFGTNQANITVDYNGLDPESNISFMSLSKSGVYKEAKVLSVTESTRTRAFETKTYTFVISLSDTDHSQIPVKVLFGGKEKTTVTLEVTMPEFSVEADAFATFAKVKVATPNPSDLAAVTNCLQFAVNGSNLSESNITRNNESGMITISGLNASSSYNIVASLAVGVEGKTMAFTTEAANDVPNGSFDASTVTVNRTGVQHGGQFRYLSRNRKVTATVKASEPDGWATVNAKTCWFGSSNINTWYQVPSVNVVSGRTVLRSVAYDHAGADLPNMSGAGASWYNTNVPTFTTRAAGEIFLGEYSFDGTEHRVDGFDFSSRPSSVSFEYSYVPVSDDPSDKGLVQISVLDASGAVIASATSELDATSSMTSKNVGISGYQFGKKAAKIQVRFVSSSTGAPTHTPTGSELNTGDVPGALNFSSPDLGENIKARATGSVLTLDNVKLNY